MSQLEDSVVADLTQTTRRSRPSDAERERQREREKKIAEEYEKCPAKVGVFERHIKFLVKCAAISLCYGIFQLASISSAYFICLGLGDSLYEICRELYKFCKIKRTVSSQEVWKTIRKAVNITAVASFYVCYFIYLQDGPEYFSRLCLIAPFTTMAVFLTDTCLIDKNNIGRVMSFMTNCWQLAFVIVIFLLFNKPVVSNNELYLTPSSTSGHSVYLVLMTIASFVLTVYLLAKMVEARVYVSRHQVENKEFMLRSSMYLMVASTTMTLFLALIYIAFINGLFYPYSPWKAVIGISSWLVFLGQIYLAVKWRSDLTILGKTLIKDIFKIYPTCIFVKRANNQIAPTSGNSQRPPNAARNSSPSGSLRNESPEAVNNSEPPSPSDPQSEEGQQDYKREDSLNSIHFIQRKNSVVFAQINAKKIFSMLQEDGLIEKEKVLAQDDEAGLNKQNSKESKEIISPQKQDSISVSNNSDSSDKKSGEQTAENKKKHSSMRSVDVQKKDSFELSDDIKSQKQENKILLRKKDSIKIQKEEVYNKMKDALKAGQEESKAAANDWDQSKVSELEESKGKTLCLICEVNEADCIIYPCNHSKVCHQCCVNMLNWRHSKCHFCRSDLLKIIVFDPSLSYKGVYKVVQVYSVNYEDDEEGNEEEAAGEE